MIRSMEDFFFHIVGEPFWALFLLFRSSMLIFFLNFSIEMCLEFYPVATDIGK